MFNSYLLTNIFYYILNLNSFQAIYITRIIQVFGFLLFITEMVYLIKIKMESKEP